MSTIHFEANWKGNRGKTGLCAKWAMSPRIMETTTESTKVNCTRCAKSLGITPAAKPVAKNQGTCPCCFRSQKTLKGAKMVHHGYQRPGYGYIVGDCFGVKYPRFEDSCEGTVAYRVLLQGIKRIREADLAKYQNNEVTSIVHTYSQYKLDAEGKRVRNIATYGYQHETVHVTVSMNDEARYVEVPYYSRQVIPSFEDLRKSAMAHLAGEIAALGSHIAELEKAIAEWKKA